MGPSWDGAGPGCWEVTGTTHSLSPLAGRMAELRACCSERGQPQTQGCSRLIPSSVEKAALKEQNPSSPVPAPALPAGSSGLLQESLWECFYPYSVSAGEVER